MKKIKYSLLTTLFISSISFAVTSSEEQVTLPSLLDVVSFCSEDKNCTSIKPVISDSAVNYKVNYETDPTGTIDDVAVTTDPTGTIDD